MAQSASAALDLLVDRIEDMTPARDPQITFRHRTTDIATPPDRYFTIQPQAGITMADASLGDPVTLRCALVVHYDQRTEAYDALKDKLDDLEDLIKRIRYINGGEWAQSSGYAFMVQNAAIEGGEVVIDFAVIYNLTVE